MDLETLIAIITALGVRELGGKVVDAWRGSRGEKRNDVQALWDENRALREEVNKQSRLLQETRGELEGLKSLYQAISQAIDLNCPYDGERCLIRSVFREHMTVQTNPMAPRAP